MTQAFIGLKDSLTPVIKVLANDDDDPLTTPNDAWTKFLFNSEVDQLPYARLLKSYERTYTARESGLHFFPEGSDSSNAEAYFQLRSSASGGLAAGIFSATIYPSRIFGEPNGFQFMRLQVANEFVDILYQIHGNYPGGDWGQIVHINASQYMFLPTLDTSGNWHSYLGTEDYFSNIRGDGVFTQIYNSDRAFTNTELALGLTFKMSLYQIDMPVNEDDYPSVVGTPAPGLKIIDFSTDAGIARMAKPGFDTDTATDDQMLFSETKVPLAIIRTGVTTVPAGDQVNVELGQAIDPSALVDCQIGVPDQPLYLPPYAGFKQITDMQYRISGTELQFQNNASIDLEVRFYVMAKDSLPETSGSAEVFETIDGRFVIRKPGTAGTNTNDIIYDSRWAYMPIVSQGWVPYASFTSDTFGGLARKRYTVSLDNDGSWKPYVMAKLKRQAKTGNTIITAGTIVFKDLLCRQMGFASHHGADSNFIAKVQDTQVDFYCGDGTDYEAAYYAASGGLQSAYLNTLGMRYYIFAVPASL